MDLSNEDRQRISEAIRSAEAKTSGEIVCVLAETSTGASALSVFVAAVVALALPWALAAFTPMPVYRMLSLQSVAFVVLLGVLLWPPVRVALLPRRMRRAAAHRVAREQFIRRGLARKKERTGILIFVSLAERYARIIADEGISSRVPQSRWQAAVDALVMHMRDGRVADGFIAAIDLCGRELATNFPQEPGSRDQLPDRIYVI
jgi:putative membrane protein